MKLDNKFHNELLDKIKIEAGKKNHISKQPKGYEGHSEKSYGLSNPQLREITKTWLKKHKVLTFPEFKTLVSSLYTKAESATEKYIAGFLLEYRPEFRRQLKPDILDTWLNFLYGWALIDSLCQSKFTYEDMKTNWPDWEKLLGNFCTSPNISKRRASLVLLTKPTWNSPDKRFSDLAFKNIEKLKHEKDILITKTISWSLRDMTKNHREEVALYLKKNQNSLPKIAVRETKRKLETGRK
jgi:3-methyladenine DNA glycosylase AlkD